MLPEQCWRLDWDPALSTIGFGQQIIILVSSGILLLKFSPRERRRGADEMFHLMAIGDSIKMTQAKKHLPLSKK